MISTPPARPKPRPDVNPHHYHRNNRSPPSVSTGLDVHGRGRPRLASGRSTALCRRLSPVNALPRLRSTCSRPKPRTKGRAPRIRNTLRKRFNALQALAIREFGKELLQEMHSLFSPKNYQPPLRRAPETRPVPRKDGFIPGTKLEM